jgi:hypothetical protein
MLAHGPITVGSWTDVSVFPFRLEPPTIFHITHAKAGSQWIHRMFHHIDYYRLVTPLPDMQQFLQQPIIAGRIYPTLFVCRTQFGEVKVPENHYKFVVIRDLRDTLLSLCFSMLFSHAPGDGIPGEIDQFRSRYQSDRFDEALMHVIRTYGRSTGNLQASWIDQGAPVFRYDELLKDDLGCFRRIFNDICKLRIEEERLQQIVTSNRFHVLSGGRKPGEADANHHYRNGMQGDWVHHYSSAHVREFKTLLSDILVATGFEKDRHW